MGTVSLSSRRYSCTLRRGKEYRGNKVSLYAHLQFTSEDSQFKQCGLLSSCITIDMIHAHDLRRSHAQRNSGRDHASNLTAVCL